MQSTNLKQLMAEGRIWFGKQSATSPRPRRRLRSEQLATFGISAIDNALPEGGLSFGAVHEWSFECEVTSKQKKLWYAPTTVVTSVLRQTLNENEFHEKQLIAWVGERIWPTPHILKLTSPADSWSWEKHAIFLRPRSKEKNLWSIIQLLRSPATLAVIADGSGLNLIATRRIQLAAQKHNALCFLIRPPWELASPSTALTKWRIEPEKSDAEERWKLWLLSAKGLPAPLHWQLEWREDDNGKTNSLSLAQAEEGRESIEKQRRRGT
ncbi:MAG: hypothetical protein U0136_06740 [Bdellovibrionota bacterium]